MSTKTNSDDRSVGYNILHQPGGTEESHAEPPPSGRDRRLSISADSVGRERRQSIADMSQVSFNDEHDDDDDHGHGHKGAIVIELIDDSLNFDEIESAMWKKHQMRRFFQDRGHWWTSNRRTTAWKWLLVIVTGVVIAVTGAFVQVFTEAMTEWKFESIYELIEEGDWGGAFFGFIFICIFLVLGAGYCCWLEPAAAGSGIPEIKAFLNGVNLSKVVKLRVLIAKVLGMCFSCASGLPLGKEGPMIHAGAIIGAVLSGGQTGLKIGFDSSWTKFQDLRTDSSKRDYVTIGAAAGVAAAFRAPIGGILLTLEEGASFWSTTLTLRAFFCAMITQLTVSLIFSGEKLGSVKSEGMFAFGMFDNLEDGQTNYRVYELFIFIAMGAAGGVLGAFFNHSNEMISKYRIKNLNKFKWKRIVELVSITALMAFISFIFSICWQKCTPVPIETEDMNLQERALLEKLVQFQCGEGKYNQLASLYMVSGDTAMRQLFHFREYKGTNYSTFDTGPLILFVIPYFLIASITSGVLAPAGLFVPTLLSGAAFGRIIGHLLNSAFPGYVADSGTYALIGSAAILGGMARMTISGTVIMLEACGNMAYLLPLMVTFGAARYAGNAINEGMYDMQIHVKGIPLLEPSLHSLGLLNYHPITELMNADVVTLFEVDRVGKILHILMTTKHNGFPIVTKTGVLRGFILRKHLCTLLKLKAFSQPSPPPPGTEHDPNQPVELCPAATVFFETFERNYPMYPEVQDVKSVISRNDLTWWVDLRSYLDPSPITVDSNTTVERAYRLFRTMGMRHLVVIDGDHKVVGILTRQDVAEHRLHEIWHHEGDEMQKQLNVDILPPAIVYPNEGLDDADGHRFSYYSDHHDGASSYAGSSYADSEPDLDGYHGADGEQMFPLPVPPSPEQVEDGNNRTDENDSPLLSLRKSFNPDGGPTATAIKTTFQKALKEPKSSRLPDRR